MFVKTYKDKPQPTCPTQIRRHVKRSGPLSYVIGVCVVIVLYIIYSYLTANPSSVHALNEPQIGNEDHFLGPDLAVLDDTFVDTPEDEDVVDIDDKIKNKADTGNVDKIKEEDETDNDGADAVNKKKGVQIINSNVQKLNAAKDRAEEEFGDNFKDAVESKNQEKQQHKEEEKPKIPFNVHNHDLDEVDEDYIIAQQHNKNPDLLPVLPKFDPNRHIHGALPDGDVFYPFPKIFPVPIIHFPNVENCPKDKPFILIIVINVANQSSHRNAIRRSWAKQTNFKPVSLRNDVSWWVVFSIGTSSGTEEILKKEQTRYGDILQGDLVDHPSEETRKTLLGFKWAAENLPASCQPLLVLKTECTVFVNTPLLTKWITNHFAQNMGVYAGKVIHDDVPIRDLRSSLQVSDHDYPHRTFPPFVQGPCYLLSMDVLTTMLTLVRTVTPIAMEDAYIGLLAEKMGRTPQNYNNFRVINRPKDQCHYLEMLFIKTGAPVVHHQIFMVVNHDKKECLDKNDL